jgi:hypothetical protein
VPGDTLVPGSQADDASVNIALPFYYYLYGSPANGARAGTDGMLVFYIGSNTGANSCLPMWNSQQVIFPHWDDLDMSPALGPGLGIYTSVTGVAPARVFNIEWRACLHSGQTCGGEVNFEVRLFERQERFDLVYGNVTGYGSGATIGVQSYRGQSVTQFACDTQSLYPGLRLSFQEPTCSNPYPTIGPTGTPTVTSTPAPPTPCTISFADVQPADYFYNAVFYLYCHQVISGYSDGTFRPYNNTTRGQLAKIVVLAQGWPLYTPPAPTFVDVPASDPFYAYVETAHSRGIISGYSCGLNWRLIIPKNPSEPCLEYRPGNNVTRGQLCKIVVLAAGWPLYTPAVPTFADVPENHTFYQYVETAYSRGIISGYACTGAPATLCLQFRPGNNATRGQISKIVYIAITQP